MGRVSVPGAGWYVEVDLPSGTTVYPDVVGDPNRNPTANGFPSLEIPTRRTRVWETVDIESNTVDMRVWKDGIRQPISELERVRQAEGETVVLEGRGGTEAETRVRKDVNLDRVSNVVTDIVTNNTSYAANVDQPPTSTETLTIGTGDTQTEWGNEFAEDDPNSPIIDASGLAIGDNEGIVCAKTNRTREANDINDKTVSTLVSPSSNASNDDAVDLATNGDFVELDWDPDYTVPGDDIRVVARFRAPDDPDNDNSFETPDIDYKFNGSTIGGFVDGADLGGDSYGWDEENPGSISDQDSMTFRIECNGNSSGGNYRLDLISIVDTRYHDPGSFDNSVDSNDALASPTTFPTGNGGKSLPIRSMKDRERVRAVTAGDISVTVNDSAGIERLGLSNDRGGSWDDNNGGTSHTTSFGGLGATLRWRVGLQGFGSGATSTPSEGFKQPEVDSFTLKADLEDIPLIVEQSFDDSLDAILREIADNFGDFIYEYRIDNNGNFSVEWTQPGLRTTSRDDPVAEFERERSVEEVVGEVVIKGGSIRTEDENITANHGTAVALNNDELVAGSETVRDSSGTLFVRGVDYEVAPLDGEITTQSSGDITDGETLTVDYSYHPKDSFASSNAPSGAKTITETLPQLNTSRACGQFARLIGEDLEGELEEGQIVIPSDEAGWDVVSAVTFDELPFDSDIELRDVQNTPAETILRVGSRQTAQDLISQIESRLRAVSQRA